MRRDEKGARRKHEPSKDEAVTPPFSPPTPHGILYIVSTPIGNLEDMTFRAVRILREVDLIAAEDTRHSRKLLSHFGISKPLTSCYDHNEAIKSDYILGRLHEGESVALISDAGTPCISDPGYQLVRAAVAAGIRVESVPGPSALLAALAGSGLPTDSFTFIGFLPNKPGKRQEKLSQLAGEGRLLAFYESPHRLVASLSDMREILGNREAVVARELTKLHEEFIRGLIDDILIALAERQVRGEVVVLVAPPKEPSPPSRPPVTDLLARLVREGYSVKDAVRQVVAETGLPRSAVYREAVGLKDRQ